MTSLISYNYHRTLTYGHGYSADQKTRWWAHFDRLQPESLLVLDDFDTAKEAKRRRPECRVVFREYRQRDGKFFMDMTPEEFYNGHAKFGENGIIISVMNEPTGYGEQNSPEDLERIATFMAKVMRLHGKEGQAICGPEFGVGHPALNRLTELDEMWQAFKDWPLHYYGAHEYGTYRGMQFTDSTHLRDVYPHRVGRYKAILSYVRAGFGYELPILINEWGIDSSFYAGDDTRKRGWRDAGLTEIDYANMLIKTANEVYYEPNIKGLNIFSHGNSGKQFSADDWKTHDVSFLGDFQRTLEDYSAQRNNPMPMQKPANAGDRTSVKLTDAPQGEINIRVGAGEEYRSVGVIRNGERFDIYRTPPVSDRKGKKWLYASVPGVTGETWVCEVRDGIFAPVNGNPAPVPLPVPPPAPQPPEPDTAPDFAMIFRQHKEFYAARIAEKRAELEPALKELHDITNKVDAIQKQIAAYEMLTTDFDLIEAYIKKIA